MLLARSRWWKSAATVLVALGFVWLLEETIFDAHNGPGALAFFDWDSDPNALPEPGARLMFTATAYCKGAITSSGVQVQEGVTAADPDLLPAGSIVELDFEGTNYDGTYTVLDTGPKVRGREIDVYIWSCYEALRFGRRPVQITVLRLGWDPHATTMRAGFVDRLFRRAPAERRKAPRRPAAPPPAPESSLGLPPSTELPAISDTHLDGLPIAD